MRLVPQTIDITGDKNGYCSTEDAIMMAHENEKRAPQACPCHGLLVRQIFGGSNVMTYPISGRQFSVVTGEFKQMTGSDQLPQQVCLLSLRPRSHLFHAIIMLLMRFLCSKLCILLLLSANVACERRSFNKASSTVSVIEM